MDTVAYRKGFEDALDVVLSILREERHGAFGEIYELSTRVRLEKAEGILQGLSGR